MARSFFVYFLLESFHSCMQSLNLALFWLFPGLYVQVFWMIFIRHNITIKLNYPLVYPNCTLIETLCLSPGHQRQTSFQCWPRLRGRSRSLVDPPCHIDQWPCRYQNPLPANCRRLGNSHSSKKKTKLGELTDTKSIS